VAGPPEQEEAIMAGQVDVRLSEGHPETYSEEQVEVFAIGIVLGTNDSTEKWRFIPWSAVQELQGTRETIGRLLRNRRG
jgi:hypothetical protein